MNNTVLIENAQSRTSNLNNFLTGMGQADQGRFQQMIQGRRKQNNYSPMSNHFI
jgi:hypothetical protein